MEYIANPVKVKAQKIIGLCKMEHEYALHLDLDDGTDFLADAVMLARYIPSAGDYLVTQEDGYVYINPREVFERKYHPVGSKVSFVQDREISSFLDTVRDRVIARGEKAESAVVIYGTYGSNFYVEGTESAIEAIGLMEVGKATMMNAILKPVFEPDN